MTKTVQVEAPPLNTPEIDEGTAIVRNTFRRVVNLYQSMGKATVGEFLNAPVRQDLKKEFEAKVGESNNLYKALSKAGVARRDSVVKANLGVHYQPLDFMACSQMRIVSPHHSSCLDTLVDLMVGHGFADEETQRILDDLTDHGIVAELDKVCQNILATGQGYLETVRARLGSSDADIVKLVAHHAPSIMRVQHGARQADQHFLYTPYSYGVRGWHSQGEHMQWGDLEWSGSNTIGSRTVPFACFGRVRPLMRTLGRTNFAPVDLPIPFGNVGEMIDFPMKTDLWPGPYGAPRWMGAQPYMELQREHLQRTFTYLHNRGTPDSLTAIWGVKVNDEQKKALQNVMNSNSGDGFGRSVVMTFPHSSQQSGGMQVERFGDQVDGDTFRELHDTSALAICSAHRVPPPLAGISTQRSMAAAAEMTQSLVIMQMLAITKVQNLISTIFRKTLGGPNGIPALRGKDFKLNRVTEIEDIQALNVMARSKQADSSMTRATEGGSPSLSR